MAPKTHPKSTAEKKLKKKHKNADLAYVFTFFDDFEGRLGPKKGQKVTQNLAKTPPKTKSKKCPKKVPKYPPN